MDNGTRLIGLALREPDVVMEAAINAGLKESWFNAEWQREAWRSMRSMVTNGLPIDAHFVADYADKNDFIVSPEEILAAERSAPSASGSADALVQCIRDEYVLRELEHLSENMWSMGKENPTRTAANLSMELMEIAGVSGTASAASVKSEIKRDWRNSLAGSLPGLPMPWGSFMHKVGGPRKKQVTTVVGHGGSGKSSMFLQWALHLGMEGIPCLVFPFEDGTRVAYERLAGMIARVPVFGVHIGRGTQEHVERLEKGLDAAFELPIYMSDRRGDVSAIQIEAQQFKARKGISAIFIDAFKDVGRSKDGVEGDNEVMSGIVSLAHRLDVPVVLGHHVRKAPSSLKGNSWESWHIGKDDLRGSGRVWDDSRAVLALQMYPAADDKWEYYFHQLKSNHGIAGVRQQVTRQPWMCWEENSVIDSVSTR